MAEFRQETGDDILQVDELELAARRLDEQQDSGLKRTTAGQPARESPAPETAQSEAQTGRATSSDAQGSISSRQDVLDLMQRVPFCVLATATIDGRPWVAPLFYNYTPDLRLVWESEVTALHSTLLADNPRAAIVVMDYESKDPLQSLYFEVTAMQVPEERLTEAVETFWQGPHKAHDRRPLTANDYKDGSPLRLYEATVEKAYCLKSLEIESLHRVERRELLSL